MMQEYEKDDEKRISDSTMLFLGSSEFHRFLVMLWSKEPIFIVRVNIDRVAIILSPIFKERVSKLYSNV